jgi:hypothetical protein
VLWNGLFPSRFRALVLEALDGTPPEGYSRPLTFCIGCWRLFFGTALMNHSRKLFCLE